MDVTMMIFLALFFTSGVPCVIAFLIIYFQNVRKPLELAKRGEYGEYTESRNIKKQIIVKEVVMLSGHYCRGLLPQTSIFCSYCGARKKEYLSHYS